MKRRYIDILGLILLLIAAVVPVASAQGNRRSSARNTQRVEWNREMLQAKIDYMARELGLTEQQKEKFAPVFEAMDKETENLMHQTRQLGKEVYKKGEKATDLELEKASEAMFEMKGRENAIEMKYYKQFKSILTPKQLFQYKMAERKFNRELMKQHRKTCKD